MFYIFQCTYSVLLAIPHIHLNLVCINGYNMLKKIKKYNLSILVRVIFHFKSLSQMKMYNNALPISLFHEN